MHRSPIGLLLLTFALLSAAITYRMGIFSAPSFILMTLAFVAFLVASWSFARSEIPPAGHLNRWMAVLLLGFLVIGMCVIVGIYAPALMLHDLGYLTLISGVHIAVMIGVVSVYLVATVSDTIRRSIFAIAFVLAVVLYLRLPTVSPAPAIDVFVSEQESAAHLLAGKNPYSTPITDIYQGDRRFGPALPAYTYLPSNLLLQTPSYATTGDVRYAHILAILLSALAIWFLCKDAEPESAELLSLLFLYHPLGLFVVEQSWTEPFILLGFAMLTLAALRGYRRTATVIGGLTLSFKQYLFFLPVHWFLFLRWRTLILLAFAVAALTAMPFALWDWQSFLGNGVFFQLQVPPRNDTIALTSLLYRMMEFQPSMLWNAAIALIATGSALWFRRLTNVGGMLLGTVLSFFLLFFVGGRALTNYYYLMAGLLLMTIAVFLRPDADSDTRAQSKRVAAVK